MHWIEKSIARFFGQAEKKPYKIPEELLAKFGEETQLALKGRFERDPREFRLYPSSVGKPLCVLQMDKRYGSDGPEAMRGIFGELVEDVVLFLIHASGLKVVLEQERLKVKIGTHELSGRLDVAIENPKGEVEVYDIKSASEYSFKLKKEQSLKDLLDSDYFGYVHQLFLYSDAVKLKPGGIIFCNKSDGSILVMPVPHHYEDIRERVLNEVKYNLKNIDKPFKRVFEDAPEIYKKRATGNRILKQPCTFCAHKFNCWPGLQTRQQIISTAKNAKIVDYSFIKEVL